MSDNPYQSPSAEPAVPAAATPSAGRPASVVLLAGLHAFAAFFSLGMPGVAGHPQWDRLLVSVITLGAAMGLWIGHRRGWWLSGMYWSYSIAESLRSFVLLRHLAVQYARELPGVDQFIPRTIVNGLVAAVCLYLLMRPAALDYCRVPRRRMAWLLGSMVAGGVLLLVAATRLAQRG